MNPLKPGDELMCSGRVDSYCSTSGTRRVALSFIVHMAKSYIHSQKYRKNAKTSINVTTKFVSEKYFDGESIKEYLKFLVHELEHLAEVFKWRHYLSWT